MEYPCTTLARGVNRQSDAERVDVVVLTDVPLPLPVDALVSADDVTPRIEDRMLAAGGVVLSDGEDAARTYPMLFHSGNAVRAARHRERERYGCDWGPPPGLRRFRYRRAVNGAHHGTALIDPAAVDDPEAWLRAALGDLASLSEAPLPVPIKSKCYGIVTEHPASLLEDAPAWAVLGPEDADFMRPIPDG